jgi:hypothetical protein
MKKISFTFFLTITFLIAKAQNTACETYFPQKIGSKFELTHYDKKGKVSVINRYVITKNTPIAGGLDIGFKVNSVDAKNKEFFTGDYNAKCQNQNLYIEAFNLFTNIPQTTDMEVIISGDMLSYPNNLSAGMSLPDVSVEMKAKMKATGMNIMTTKTRIFNRQVIGKEMVEVPAGKFECMKITYESETKVGIMGTFKVKTTEYIAKNVGIVKSESIDEKGKKTHEQVLSKFEK